MYRLRTREAAKAEFEAGHEASFRTQRPAGASFTFTVQGDSHPERLRRMYDPDLYICALTNVAADKPDFHFLMGDDFSIERVIERGPPQGEKTRDAVNAIYASQRSFLGIVGKSTPLMLVNGNQTLTVAASIGLLANDVDVDGPSLGATVAGPPAHGQLTLAAMSKAYIAYCDLKRPGEAMKIAACFTQGDSDYLFVGRNGLFYDRKGRDWDATITSQTATIPFRFEIATKGATATGSFFEGDRKVASSEGTYAGGTLTLVWDHLNTTLTLTAAIKILK